MGRWQWRKSFGRGPFRISLSKKGVGYSVGIPGIRVGRSPNGRTYISQSIPGTGLRKITYLGKGTSPGGPLATPPTVGSPPSVPGPLVAPVPTSTGLHPNIPARALAFARSIGQVFRQVVQSLTRSILAVVDWLGTRSRAGWTYSPPPLVLPTPASTPPSSAPTVSPPPAPPAVTLAPPSTAPTSAPSIPWWKQKLDP